MQLLADKSSTELLQSAIAELAKARAELRCAEEDLKKSAGRIGFLIVLANELINRQRD
jgi:hypothetical protein